MKTRVYDLSKELGVDSKSLVDVLIALGHDVKSHMSAITEEAADEIRVMRGARPKLPPKPKEAPPKKPKEAEEEVKKEPAARKAPAAKKPKETEAAARKKPAAKRKPAVKKERAGQPPQEEAAAAPAVAEKPDAAAQAVAAALTEALARPTASKPTPRAEPLIKEEEIEPEAIRPEIEPDLEEEDEEVGVLLASKWVKPGVIKKVKPPEPKSRIIGKIDLPAKFIEQSGKARHKRRGKGAGGSEEGDGEVALAESPDAQLRPKKKKKKVFFTKGGQPLYHPKTKRPAAPQRVLIPDELTVTLPVSVKDLSALMGVKAQTILKKMMLSGRMLRINDSLDEQTIQLIGVECGKQIEVMEAKTIETILEEKPVVDTPEDIVERAPVVTFLGHVDHGKTSLLDSIRKTRVVDGEAGGITQHIGAYQVEARGRRITFLDTPGHEAFTAMRARGANITDLVILVVAADDGVMPQTEEAINHARAANVPILVALNKVDKPEANVMRARQQLSSLGLTPEEWGGKTIFVEVCAITGQGVDNLIEMLCLEAEMLELKSNPRRPARGTVLEARMSEGLGVVANVLVQQGTLRKGDAILSGRLFCRVRTLLNDAGKVVAEAGPSTPVSVIGFSEPPEAGDPFQAVSDLAIARQIASARGDLMRTRARTQRTHVTLENLYSHIEQGRTRELRVILKADVKGSVEVLLKSLKELATSEVKVSVLHSGVGAINESDVLLADASDAVIIGFHIIPDERARLLATHLGVDVRLYQVIYHVTAEIRSALEGMLEPTRSEVVMGHAAVREVFKVSHAGSIAGCYVTDGRIERNARVRLSRDGAIIYDGKLESLRRFKDDVKEVKEAFECGMKIAGYDDIKVGDVIEAYSVELVARTLADSR